MREVAIPDYARTPGNKGAFILHRLESDAAHFIMLTFWESLDAIKAFAGDDVERAKYYDFDAQYLLEMEPLVQHHVLYDG